jgi:predicted nuclease of predicted toxin-antitoxin system
MKIIVDMCLSPKWADALNAAGIEARHWSSIGAGNAPDSSIFDFARRDGSVILTADLDFGTLLAGARSGKPSVIQLRLPRISLEKAWEPTLRALTQLRAEIEAGALVSIDAVTARVRILPLGP